MCNLLIQNEGNSCSSTLSRENNVGQHTEELLLNSAAESLAGSSAENKEEQDDDTEQGLAQDSESQWDKGTSPQVDSEITLEITEGTSSPMANGEMAAEITSAKAISVATLKSSIQYNLFAIAVRCYVVLLSVKLILTDVLYSIIEPHRCTRRRSLYFVCKES